MSMSISASLDNTYNGVVLTTGNAVQNQIMYGGNAGIYTILLDAGFMVGYLNKWPLERSLRLACVCGALSTQRAGGIEGQPTLEEAMKYVP